MKRNAVLIFVVLAAVVFFALQASSCGGPLGDSARSGQAGNSVYDKDFTWRDYGLWTKLPDPKKRKGHVVTDSDDVLSLNIYEVNTKEFTVYVEACMELGYTEDYSRSETEYTANDAAGYDLSLGYYPDEDRMSVRVDSYDVSWMSDFASALF